MTDTHTAAGTGWLQEFMATARTGDLPVPPSAWWIVTRSCNLKCYYSR